MSQRSEKYNRRTARRVSNLEDRTGAISDDMTSLGVRVSMLEEIAKPAYIIKAPGPGYTMPAPRKPIRQRRRGIMLALIALATGLLIIGVVRTVGAENNTAADMPAPVPASTVAVTTLTDATTESWDGVGEDPQEAEKIEAALLAQGYLSTAVPLDYTLQDIMRTACTEYGCPYTLALAVAEVESNFNMDTVGAAGEVGIMQLNPGPGGSYHAELAAATGRDPTTPVGNIYCGVYLLGKYMADYQDPVKAAMAYNMGDNGAREAWAAGITSTHYTKEVMEAMEVWECTVNEWGGA